MTAIPDYAVIRTASIVDSVVGSFSLSNPISDLPAFSGLRPVVTHSAAPRTGVDLSIAARGHTITARQWRLNGVPIVGATGTTLAWAESYEGQRISCRCTLDDERVVDTPELPIPLDLFDARDKLDADSLRIMCPHGSVNHVAVRSGNWSSASTWDSGMVPGAGDKVLISRGVRVTYDVTANSPALDWIRVDGRMRWERNTNTHLLCDTIFGEEGSHILVGDSLSARIAAGVTATIEFRSDANIDLSRDPLLMSRGLISFGTVETFGANKKSYIKASTAPMTDDTSVTLASAPTGWNVGDEILIPGTFMWGGVIAPNWPVAAGTYPMEQNEIRTITAIDGNTVSFTGGLLYDHDHQNDTVARTDLLPDIALLTRNIIFRSEDGDETPRHRRGWFMVAHAAGDFNLWDAAFVSMGRSFTPLIAASTDRVGRITSGQFEKVPVDNGGVFGTPETLTAESNVWFRPSVRVYDTGFSEGNGLRGGKAVHCVNLLVRETPGHGLMQDNCMARFWGCVAYDFQGGGIVGINSTETGFWSGCAAFTARNTTHHDNIKNIEGGLIGNSFHSGVGLGLSSRAVRVSKCVAQGCTYGNAWWHRVFSLRPAEEGIDGEQHAVGSLELNDLALGNPVSRNKHSIVNLRELEVYGCVNGLVIVKSAPENNHNLWSVIRNIKVWSCRTGALSEYVGNYLFDDADMVAAKANGAFRSVAGLSTGANASQVYYRNPNTVGGWTRGIELSGGTVFYNDDEANIEDDRFLVAGHTDSGSVTAIDQSQIGTNPAIVFATVPALSPVIVTPASAPSWNGTGNVTMDATIQDSVSTARNAADAMIPATYSDNFYWNPTRFTQSQIERWLTDNGYWTVGGSPAIKPPRYFTDRLSGEYRKIGFPINLTGTLTSYTNNGSIASWPAAIDDFDPISKSVAKNGVLFIDLAAELSITEGEGQTLFFSDGFVPPEGLLLPASKATSTAAWTNPNSLMALYRPAGDFVGTDEMTVFLTDRKGNFPAVKITVTVT